MQQRWIHLMNCRSNTDRNCLHRFSVLPVICLAFSRISSGPGCAECFDTPVFKQLLIINGHPAAKNGRNPKLLASIGRLGAVRVVHNAFQINARVKRSIPFDQVVQITQ